MLPAPGCCFPANDTRVPTAAALPPLRPRQLRQMRINELGKKVTDWELKLKQQQQLYESVRSDRNLYSKNLIDAQDEIAEMKRKLKIMDHQIEQLKEDIAAKVRRRRASRGADDNRGSLSLRHDVRMAARGRGPPWGSAAAAAAARRP